MALLCVAYVLPGLTGHDPWKQDETYVTSIIHHVATTEDWVVPTSAGQPFLEKPPLYYVVAKEFAHAFAPRLPLHDGARLSNALWLSIIFGCTALAARRMWPGAAAPASSAVLTLMASVGLVLHAHLLEVDVSLMAGFAIGLLGFCLTRDHALIGGAVLGTGVGVGFLAKGLLAPGCFGLTALLLPALFTPWRRRSYAKALFVAMAAALPWVVIWPAALYLTAPGLFDHWLWQENVGRFLGYAQLGADPEPWYYAKVLPWFAFPALPLALWSLWRRRSNWRVDGSLQLLTLFTIVLLTTLTMAGSMRAQYLLPVLLPLALLSAAEIHHVPLTAARTSALAAIATFGLMLTILWGTCLLITMRGSPPDWLPLEHWLSPAPAPRASWAALALAATISVAWLTSVIGMPSLRSSPVLGWALGITATWVLLSTLWLPWINEAKSYRSMFEEMHRFLPTTYDCMNTLHLGESEAAMLDYEGGVVPLPVANRRSAQCQLVWIQGREVGAAMSPSTAWRLLWAGHRPGDGKELHRLYAR